MTEGIVGRLSDQTINVDPNAEISQSLAAASSNEHQEVPEDEKAGIEAVRVYLETYKVGHVTNPMYPLSKQLKNEVLTTFPQDRDFFKTADRMQSLVGRSHIFAQCAVFPTLLVYLWLSSGAILSWSADAGGVPAPLASPFASIAALQDIFSSSIATYSRLSSGKQDTEVALFIFILGAIATVVQLIIKRQMLARTRWVYIGPFASKVVDHYRDIKELLAPIAGRMGSRQDLVREAEMSANWAQIFLLYVKRLDAFDRYITTVFWKMGSAGKNIDAFFGVLKLLVFAAWGVLMISMVPPIGVKDATEWVFLLAGIQFVVGIVGLIALDQRSYGMWAHVIDEATKNLHPGLPFAVIGGRVRAIVLRARGIERK